jgi:hypothetical protein
MGVPVLGLVGLLGAATLYPLLTQLMQRLF